MQHEDPNPGPFWANTSSKGDNLKSERNISSKNYLSQGKAVQYPTQSHTDELRIVFEPNSLWLFSIHLQI